MVEKADPGFAADAQPTFTQGIDRRHFLGGLALGAGAGMLASLGVAGLAHAASPSTRNRIVVTAPTGNIGHRVLDKLLDSGALDSGVPVRVIARDPSRLAAATRDRLEVVQGSHGDAAVVDEAFKDADTVFWLCPADPHAESVMAAYVDFTRPACAAIKAHGVRRVVGISALGRGTPVAASAGYVTASLAMDDLIAGTGAHFRALTMPSFMDNIARQAASIRDRGMFFLPINGDRKLPAVATRDIGAVAARLLLDTSWRGRDEVPVLGPEDLSFNDMARIMSDVLGKPVRYQQVGFEAYKAGFVQRGMSDAMAQGMTDMARAKNAGLDNAVQRTPANSTPTRFRQWCEEELRPAVLR
ncbi:NAD(P)H-binding protein [Xanthomonas sp. AmX2]|uniref:NmrA family NAD(P)-binding protein n=1 Tax=Xanthomonas sp. TaxID=29446 RepID=UPI00197E041A|nr:NAD(P)H-binding protein [Xanthomonas sp.]MBN6150247.1 NAD(P)H-binding protein [Xanthomonas sp.]